MGNEGMCQCLCVCVCVNGRVRKRGGIANKSRRKSVVVAAGGQVGGGTWLSSCGSISTLSCSSLVAVDEYIAHLRKERQMLSNSLNEGEQAGQFM